MSQKVIERDALRNATTAQRAAVAMLRKRGWDIVGSSLDHIGMVQISLPGGDCKKVLRDGSTQTLTENGWTTDA